MVWIVEALLFLIPVGAYVLWRRSAPPGAATPGWLLGLAGAMAALMVAMAVWLGVVDHGGKGRAYVPAVLGPDGQVVPGGPRGG